jgi:general secretion pathway protein G
MPHRAFPNPCRPVPRRLLSGMSGMTIIEVMLAVALVGILAALALPAYQSHRERVRTAEAVIAIKNMDVKLQQYRLDQGSFPEDLAAIGMLGHRDPWGNPYQYANVEDMEGKGKARKNKNLVPINTDFDLYSMGPDGASVGPLTAKASRDDIVRANNGRFVGTAAEYDP